MHLLTKLGVLVSIGYLKPFFFISFGFCVLETFCNFVFFCLSDLYIIKVQQFTFLSFHLIVYHIFFSSDYWLMFYLFTMSMAYHAVFKLITAPFFLISKHYEIYTKSALFGNIYILLEWYLHIDIYANELKW